MQGRSLPRDMAPPAMESRREKFLEENGRMSLNPGGGRLEKLGEYFSAF